MGRSGAISGLNIGEYWQSLSRAFGPPAARGVLRQRPGDFRVRELLGFDPSGDGEHDFLLVRKESANTRWVAQQLA